MKTASISIPAWGDHAMALEASEEACFPCPWSEVWRIQSDFCNLHLSCRIFSSLVMIILFVGFPGDILQCALSFLWEQVLEKCRARRDPAQGNWECACETRYDNWTQQHPCPQMRGWHFHQEFQQKNPLFASWKLLHSDISFLRFCEHLVERGNEPDEAQHGSLSKYHYLCETHKSNSMKSEWKIWHRILHKSSWLTMIWIYLIYPVSIQFTSIRGPRLRCYNACARPDVGYINS